MCVCLQICECPFLGSNVTYSKMVGSCSFKIIKGKRKGQEMFFLLWDNSVCPVGKVLRYYISISSFVWYSIRFLAYLLYLTNSFECLATAVSPHREDDTCPKLSSPECLLRAGGALSSVSLAASSSEPCLLPGSRALTQLVMGPSWRVASQQGACSPNDPPRFYSSGPRSHLLVGGQVLAAVRLRGNTFLRALVL